MSGKVIVIKLKSKMSSVSLLIISVSRTYSFTFKVFYMQLVIQEKPNFTRHAYIWSESAVERLYCLMDSNSIEKNKSLGPCLQIIYSQSDRKVFFYDLYLKKESMNKFIFLSADRH